MILKHLDTVKIPIQRKSKECVFNTIVYSERTFRMSKTVVLVTTFVTNPFQETMLTKCIESVQTHYPNADCVILNDNHKCNVEAILTKKNIPLDRIQIVKTPAPRSGECNAYIWAADNAEAYDTFLFIHDSVILLGQVPEPKEKTTWNPLWYAECRFANHTMSGKDIQAIAEKLDINGKNGLIFYKMILGNQIYVTFGGMAIWTSAFSVFLRDKTNIKEAFPMCNTRGRRCFLERIITAIFLEAHPDFARNTFKSLASCGDIHRHGNTFKNRDFTPTLANNKYALKVWQGR